MLWVATPSDWYVRTPGKRAGPHYQRIQNLLIKARALRMQIVILGPPGYFWKQGPIKDVIEDLKLSVIRMRLCHFGIKFDRSSKYPSGSYIQVATSCPHIPINLWKCTCGSHKEHDLDWYAKISNVPSSGIKHWLSSLHASLINSIKPT